MAKQTEIWVWRNDNGAIAFDKGFTTWAACVSQMKGYSGHPVKFIDAKSIRAKRRAGIEFVGEILKELNKTERQRGHRATRARDLE